MKFIFPQNYNLKNKFLGILDYSTIFINIVWIYLIFNIVSIFSSSLSTQISIVIIFCFPLILFSIFQIHGENIFQIIIYILKYLLKPKLYIFYK